MGAANSVGSGGLSSGAGTDHVEYCRYRHKGAEVDGPKSVVNPQTWPGGWEMRELDLPALSARCGECDDAQSDQLDPISLVEPVFHVEHSQVNP